jgi:phospholipid-transporting ATPase
MFNSAAPIKRTAVERQVNVQIVFLFIFLLALSIGSTIGSSIRTWFFSSQQWYLFESSSLTGRGWFIRSYATCLMNLNVGFSQKLCRRSAFPSTSRGLVHNHFSDILTFIILYNNLIPISLIVTMEVVKFQQAQLINFDLDMYYARTDTPALCRTSSLVEELGQIEYVFSDKTGTLTCNEMEFRCCSIAGTAYADVVDEAKRDAEDGREGWKTFSELKAFLEDGNPFVNVETGSGADVREREFLREFLTLLAVCHTVIPELRDGKTVYQASSPDEAALVAGAELLGYQFHVRGSILPDNSSPLIWVVYCRQGSPNRYLLIFRDSHRNSRF